jgi:hypothetical protein
MKKLCFTVISIFITLNLFSQIKSEIEISNTIKGFKSNSELKRYLIKHKLIPVSKDTTTLFHTGKIQVDIFKKNLFQDLEDEIVIQLRENLSYSVNVFYYKNKVLTKVPGQIFVAPKKEDSYGYSQSLTFSFENIFKPSCFSIVSRNYSEYIRTTMEKIKIWDIREDTIYQVYAFDLSNSTYSGVRIYNFKTDGKYDFVSLNNGYPKVLNIHQEINNEDNMSRNDEGKIISGDITEGFIKKEVYFDDVKGYWIVSRSDEEKKIKMRHIENED